MSIKMILVGFGETPDTSQEAIDRYISLFPTFSGKAWSGRCEQIVHVTNIPNVEITYLQIFDPVNDSDEVMMIFLNSGRFDGGFMRRSKITTMDKFVQVTADVTRLILEELVLNRPVISADISETHPILPNPKHKGLVFESWGSFFNERMSEIRRESIKSI